MVLSLGTTTSGVSDRPAASADTYTKSSCLFGENLGAYSCRTLRVLWKPAKKIPNSPANLAIFFVASPRCPTAICLGSRINSIPEIHAPVSTPIVAPNRPCLPMFLTSCSRPRSSGSSSTFGASWRTRPRRISSHGFLTSDMCYRLQINNDPLLLLLFLSLTPGAFVLYNSI